jgi:hypothetical protein
LLLAGAEVNDPLLDPKTPQGLENRCKSGAEPAALLERARLFLDFSRIVAGLEIIPPCTDGLEMFLLQKAHTLGTANLSALSFASRIMNLVR